MTDKEFKRLSRAQLIEIIYQFQLELDKVNAEKRELANELAKFNVEVEFADENNIVLMITPELNDVDFNRVLSAFSSLSPRPAKKEQRLDISWDPPISKVSVRTAMLSKSEVVPATCAEGRICASPAISFPPAIPIVVSGELITDKIIKALLYYGIENIDVLK